MAVSKVHSYLYVGLSGDSKPAAPDGAEFRETDTALCFYRVAGAWVAGGPYAGSGGGGGGSSSDGGTTGTRTQIADTTVEGVAIAQNTGAKRRKFVNDSTGKCYLGEGTTVVTSSNYTVDLNVGDFYETTFQGQMRCLWATDPNNGSLRITEITA